MTIMQKVEMNLPELIDYVWKNKLHSVSFGVYNSTTDKIVRFDNRGNFRANADIEPYETFKFEIEETITEDTIIDRMVHVYLDDNENLRSEIYFGESIGKMKWEEANIEESLSFYYMYDNGKLELIWGAD